MSIEHLDEVQAVAHEVLTGVPKGSMSNATPCSEWDLGSLIDHLIGSQYLFAQFATGTAPSEAESHPSQGDFVAAFDQSGAKVRSIVTEPGFSERALKLPFGDFTGEQFIDFVCLETLTHAWDVAQATSQSSDFAPGPSQHLLGVATKMMGGSPRAANPNFAAETTAAADAHDADRLAAYLGRTAL
jgi:uncharacterized protein (TIGR03086 family)